MSVTVAHRPHIHLPFKSIAIFLVAAAVAAGVLVIVNQPWEEQSATTTTTSATGTQAIAVPAPEPWSMLRVHPELTLLYGEPAAVPMPERWSMLKAHPELVPTAEGQTEVVPRHNLVIGTLLNGEEAYVAQPPAPYYAPGAVSNARPLNFTAGGTR